MIPAKIEIETQQALLTLQRMELSTVLQIKEEIKDEPDVDQVFTSSLYNAAGDKIGYRLTAEPVTTPTPLKGEEYTGFIDMFRTRASRIEYATGILSGTTPSRGLDNSFVKTYGFPFFSPESVIHALSDHVTSFGIDEVEKSVNAWLQEKEPLITTYRGPLSPHDMLDYLTWRDPRLAVPFQYAYSDILEIEEKYMENYSLSVKWRKFVNDLPKALRRGQFFSRVKTTTVHDKVILALSKEYGVSVTTWKATLDEATLKEVNRLSRTIAHENWYSAFAFSHFVSYIESRGIAKSTNPIRTVLKNLK